MAKLFIRLAHMAAISLILLGLATNLASAATVAQVHLVNSGDTNNGDIFYLTSGNDKMLAWSTNHSGLLIRRCNIRNAVGVVSQVTTGTKVCVPIAFSTTGSYFLYAERSFTYDGSTSLSENSTLYRYHVATGQKSLVSVDTAGVQIAGGVHIIAGSASLSSDGKYAAFLDPATRQVLLRDIETGVTTLIRSDTLERPMVYRKMSQTYVVLRGSAPLTFDVINATLNTTKTLTVSATKCGCTSIRLSDVSDTGSKIGLITDVSSVVINGSTAAIQRTFQRSHISLSPNGRYVAITFTRSDYTGNDVNVYSFGTGETVPMNVTASGTAVNVGEVLSLSNSGQLQFWSNQNPDGNGSGIYSYQASLFQQ